MQETITFINSTISKSTPPDIITLQQRIFRTIKRQNFKDGCALVSLTNKVYINVLYDNRLIMLEPRLYRRSILTEIADEPFMVYLSQVLSTPGAPSAKPPGSVPGWDRAILNPWNKIQT